MQGTKILETERIEDEMGYIWFKQLLNIMIIKGVVENDNK